MSGSDPGRTQWSNDAERAFLGGILLGGSNKDLDLLDATDFFLPSHRLIFRHLKLLRDQGKPIADTVLLYQSLEGAKEIEEVGGVDYISRLPDGLPRVSNLAHYAEIVKTKAAVRDRLTLCRDMAERLARANGNAAEVLTEVSSLSAHLREEVGQKRIVSFKSGADLENLTHQTVDWIVRGFIAAGAVTELTAKIKTGKSTFMLAGVRAILEGLPFLDQPTRSTRCLYLTEQPPVSFREALQRAELLGREDFVFLLHSETRGSKWPDIASAAAAECKRLNAKLLIVDTLAQFAGLVGDSENNSGDALAAMQPLQQAAADGIGVVIIRHERKSGGDVGDSGRGSSAFAGAVDIVLALRRPEGNSRKTVRVLQSLSRFSETPAELLIDLTEQGYVALGEPRDAAVKEAKDSILAVAPKDENEAQTLKDLASAAGVARATAQRAVEELLSESMLGRNGKGKRGDPFRYFISENPFCPTSHIEGQKKTNPDLWSDGQEAGAERFTDGEY